MQKHLNNNKTCGPPSWVYMRTGHGCQGWYQITNRNQFLLIQLIELVELTVEEF